MSTPSPNPLIARLEQLADEKPTSPFLDVDTLDVGTLDASALGDRCSHLSYGAAYRRITVAADELARLADGRAVLLQGQNEIDWVVSFLAAQAAGVLVVSVPEQAREEQIDRLVGLLGTAVLLRPATGGMVRGQGRHAAIPAAAAFAVPTSGTTGAARLALRSAASLLAEGMRYVRLLDLDCDDEVLATIPICHAFCLGLALGGTLAAGCSLRLRARFSPRGLRDELLRRPPSVLPLVPSAARLLAAAWGRSPAPALRHVVIGAGPVSAQLEARLMVCLGRRPARNYGSSETGTTLGTAGEEVVDGVTGRPLPGVEAQIADDGHGGPGALFVRSAAPFLGYLDDEGFDGSRTSPDGWYSTGDLAQQVGDALRVVGRIGQGLRRGGRTIQPAEVEATLRRYGEVVDAVVVGGVDAHGEETLEIHVELDPGSGATAGDLRAHLEASLESYKVPGQWRLYQELPRTSGGKIDRARLCRADADAAVRGRLFAALAGHRLSTAVIVAQRVGLLAALARDEGVRRSDLPAVCEGRAENIELLVEILVGAGLVSRGNDDELRLADSAWSPDFLHIVALEERLREDFLSIDRVEQLVRRGAGGAPKVDDAFARLYRRVMGASARRCALLAWRRADLPPGPVADVGRPAGEFARIVSRRDLEREITVHEVPLDTLAMPPALASRGKALAGLYVYNVLRYLIGTGGADLADLAARVGPNGVLILADLFVDGPSGERWLRPSLALDWAAFGSAEWRRGDALCARLRELGFTRLRRFRSDTMFDVILARRDLSEKRS